jgi:hypothetical protein
VRIADFGAVTSAPFYQPMFDALQAAGYTLDRNVRVAGYDARLTPDLGGFLERTKRLDEDTTATTATGRCTSSATRTGRCTRSTYSRTRARRGRRSTSTAVEQRAPQRDPHRLDEPARTFPVRGGERTLDARPITVHQLGEKALCRRRLAPQSAQHGNGALKSSSASIDASRTWRPPAKRHALNEAATT